MTPIDYVLFSLGILILLLVEDLVKAFLIYLPLIILSSSLLSATPNDPLYPQQWALKNPPGIALDRLKRKVASSKEIVVAVIDTGVDPHPDLRGALFKCYDAIRDTEEPCHDNDIHGTHVAGIIGATIGNNLGISGVAKVKLISAQFLGEDGSGSLFHAIRALKWADSQGAHIINNSWGGGGHSEPLAALLRELSAKGILLVGAAGNSGLNTDRTPHYPSGYPEVISVGSIDSFGRLSSFSNYGKESVDILAPGSRILSLKPQERYVKLSGTSMASPLVSGSLAVLLQRNKPATKSLFGGARRKLTDKAKYGILSLPRSARHSLGRGCKK